MMIDYYVKSSEDPRATIEFQQTDLGEGPTPTVAAFSSRGPNLNSLKNVLKTDLIAPGTRVRAAWPTNKQAVKVSQAFWPKVKFNFGVSLNLASNFIISSALLSSIIFHALCSQLGVSVNFFAE